MSEQLLTQEPEPEEAVGPLYLAEYGHIEDHVQRQHTAPLVVKALREDQYELNPQGKIGYYLHEQMFTDTCLRDWWVFIHDIRKVSGKHRHQGGLVLFILEGRGYTTMNGERFDWKAGDLVLMPLLPERVEHQHFNSNPGTGAKWMAFIHIPSFKEVGGELTQSSLDPEWVEKTGITSWKGATVATEDVE